MIKDKFRTTFSQSAREIFAIAFKRISSIDVLLVSTLAANSARVARFCFGLSKNSPSLVRKSSKICVDSSINKTTSLFKAVTCFEILIVNKPIPKQAVRVNNAIGIKEKYQESKACGVYV